MQLPAGAFTVVPVTADFNGDGVGDPGIYSPATGDWVIALSSCTLFPCSLQRTLGGPGFIPVRGDFDGDGTADVAVYEVSTGTWSFLPSGAPFGTPVSRSWGGTGYSAVPRNP